jgi:uncharacterized protein (DUF2126 family)
MTSASSGIAAPAATGAASDARGVGAPAGDALEADLAAHDEALRARGLAVWIGAEPTFTDPRSQDPWWLVQAEGGDKEPRARALLERLMGRLCPTAELLRAVGRHFHDEPAPRFALGARWPRSAPPGATGAPGAPPGWAASWWQGEPVATPPPASDTAWLTVTPDPGVVEVNLAPAPDLRTFLRWSRELYDAAAEVGLSPRRFRYNGQETDSGGGGQITFGGPTPETSPFLLAPWILPGLVRYLNRHPALSYLYAPECVGSASQGPRPDEGGRERFEELEVALDLLQAPARAVQVAPAELWSTLAPLLGDASGNSHRAEVNVEKLWNPELPGRGCLGLCELRSLRMPPSADEMAALAALFRAVVARVAGSGPPGYVAPLCDFGATLHDRYALGHVLRADLRAVLADLSAEGLGLGLELEALLLLPREPIAVVACGPARLVVSPALEFWPLIGDVASQERAGARRVDASTARVEVRVEVPERSSPGRLLAQGWELPLRASGPGELTARSDAHVVGVRYRSYVPSPGLHPGLRAHDPLTLRWEPEPGASVFEVELHAWIPGGGVYDGLPLDVAEAARRRAERVIVRQVPRDAATVVARALPDRLRPDADRWTVDLRRLP